MPDEQVVGSAASGHNEKLPEFVEIDIEGEGPDKKGKLPAVSLKALSGIVIVSQAA